MNKNAIQKFAIWARNELIDQVKQRAFQYGISDIGFGEEDAAVIAGRVLSNEEQQQRHSFVRQIKEYGYQEAVEEVAYTWFNRFVALRFMEVNDYLPTHVRVFSDANGDFNPEILKEVLHLDVPGLDKAKVSELLNANKTEELYRYLLLTQCNALNEALPEMFEKLGSYTEMLLPNNILKPEGVIGRLVKDIPEDDFRDAVQIIGWLYQYYNTEPKQAVFDGLKKNVKISKENIPAATQLFTPDWIVRYMVENSLGRLWLESHPLSTLKTNWKYYLDEAEQTPEVAERLRVQRSQSPVKSPEDICLIDPCMGSGHILVYAFDVLMQIYESVGVSPRDAAKLILEKNLYGLDIDRRAYQLAYFALMMKARQYNRRIFAEDVEPQVYYPAGFPDGEEYGSLVKVDVLPPKPEEPREITLFTETYETALNAWNFKRLLAQKYDVVVTNPPYMGSSGMGAKLSEFVKKNYPDSKRDLSTAFMEQTLHLCKPTGFMAMINIPVWMFILNYESLREKLVKNHTLMNMLHFGRGIFGADFGTTAFVFNKTFVDDYCGHYRKLYLRHGSVDTPEQKETWFLQGIGSHFKKQTVFGTIPGSPIAYWISDTFTDSFKNRNLGEYAEVITGMTTGDNNKFLRLWFEVESTHVALNETVMNDITNQGKYWIPYSKGGARRNWYGNYEYLVDWSKKGEFNRSKTTLQHLYLREALTWPFVTSGMFSARYLPKGFLWDVAGSPCFFSDETTMKYVLAILCSKITDTVIKIINPTINAQAADLAKVPIIVRDDIKSEIVVKTDECIGLSRADWDAFETSWDFNWHPLVELKEGTAYGTDMSNLSYTVESAYKNWETACNERFNKLKANEEELNRIFIDIYGLQDELMPKVEDEDVTVRRADLGREIRSLISYAVGCMFGRYSLDVEGLAYAGGDWDVGKYRSFIPDKDNIIPVCDDEYFDDDIVGRFVEFVKTVYGEATLEENLRYIADALGGKGTPREVIRNYFLNDFYADHCKIYQKRPIYWLFDSGKKNGFKALVYLHRYSRDLLAKLRTDYVHEQQERYRTQLSHIGTALNTASGPERARLLKQQNRLTEQLREIGAFEEKVHHLADRNIDMDLDDGVKKNYEIFTDVLVKL